MKVAYIISFIVFFYSWATPQDKNYRLLVESQNLEGITGNIITPSPFVTEKEKLIFGLHRFKISVSYGFLPSCEMGFNFDLEEFSSLNFNGETSNSSIGFHAKYQFLKQYPSNKYFDLSLGFNNNAIYTVIGKQLEDELGTIFQMGMDYCEESSSCFFAIVRPLEYSCFIFDYSTRTNASNFGWRVLLSPNVKLDIFLIDIIRFDSFFSSFVFGLTLVG